MRGLANHILTATAATVFLAEMIFAQLLDFTAKVQTRGGDGFKTEALSSSWWNILIEKSPMDAQFFALLIFSIPILAFVILSRSIIFKTLFSILFLDQAWHAGKVFMSGERLVDRNGFCLRCPIFRDHDCITPLPAGIACPCSVAWREGLFLVRKCSRRLEVRRGMS
jgi:hypothetical protein